MNAAMVAPLRTSGAGDAEALLRLIEECQTSGIARHALLLRLSNLPRTMTRPHHLRLAHAAVEPLLRADRARLFRLGDKIAADLVMIWRGEAEQPHRVVMSALEQLFGQPDLPDSISLDGSPARSLAEILLLPRDAMALVTAIDAATASPVPAPDPTALAPALDAASLAMLEAGLAGADMSRFARRRDVCELQPGGQFALRWETRFLCAGELTETLAPGRSARADPWLYRRLTRTLDLRMLALLGAQGELREAGPFAINLNVASILGPEFLRFDTALPARLRGCVVLDLHPADMLADPAAFQFARDFARSRYYRLLLRGIAAELIDVLPLALNGVDLLQLRWSAALSQRDDLPGDPSRMVLAGADTDAAIAWGHAHGITLFCGRAARRGGHASAALRIPHAVEMSRKRALGEAAARA